MQKKLPAAGVFVMTIVLGCGGGPDIPGPGARDPASAATIARGITQGELLRVFGPYRTRASGSSFFNLYFRVPATWVGHCSQAAGDGEFRIGSTYGYDGESYFKAYRCTILLTTRQVLRDRGLLDNAPYSVDQLSHDYYDYGQRVDPNYSNPDRDSTRYLEFSREGYFHHWSGFYLGANMAPEYYAGSPEGRDGYYHVVNVRCDPRTPDRPASLEDVQRQCDEAEMRRLAADATTGPTEIKVVGIDSPYYP